MAVNKLYPGSSTEVVAPTIAERLERCGIAAEVVMPPQPADDLPLDGPSVQDAALLSQVAARQASFRPDAVMLVSRTGAESRVDQRYGVAMASLSQVRFNVQLLDVASKRTVYRAAADLRIAPYALAPPEKEFARLLVQQLADDGILQGCPPPTKLP